MKLPDNTKIRNYTLRVKNLDEMCLFYERNLGLKLKSKNDNRAEFSVDGNENYMLKLIENKDAMFKARDYPGLYHIAIKFSDRESLAKIFLHLFDEGQKFQGFADHLVSEAIYLKDPEENGIELYIDKPKNVWKWKMGEVEMSNEPLNLNVLTESIKDRNEPFKGMDANAEIGHIHIQVSELNKAKKFYHEILGMDITCSSYNGALFFSAAGYHHHIGANIWHSKNSSPLPADSTGLMEFSIYVPDKNAVEEIMSNAEEAKLVIDKENFIIKDLDNNKIHITL